MQKQNELLAEQEKLEVEKQNYQNHLADETKEYEKFKTAREYLEESFTKRFGEEMQKQEDKAVSTLNTIINKYRELALMQHEANMANFQQQVLHNAYGGAVPKGRLTVV
ncbi:MAG: hypothetical protein LBU27_08830 [Candidatus Peribacteria bacterium]|jgi:uncharacterized protein YeaO (DUF488 family)|nr:hypothetical protein [Candidatus Peribacteria bacterium]